MSFRTPHVLLLATVVLFTIIAGTAARAEISVDPTGTLILGTVVDDPDPVGIWLQYRPVAPNQVLNPSGHARGDAPPHIVWRANAWPVAVWAYNAGTDHDIAFSEWDGGQWTTTEFLTSGLADELDPRLAIEADGTIHVVWWTPGTTDDIYLSTRPAGTTLWDAPILVTTGSEEGRRPAITVESGTVRVAYERDSTEPEVVQDIAVATRQPAGSFTFELVGSTVRTDDLDVMIHAQQGHLWLDWKHAADEFGGAEWLGSTWSPILPEPWTDPSWVGVEGVRKTIRNQVLAP